MNFFYVKITIYANILFTLVLTDPCLDLRKDKNDGLRIFTSSPGIHAIGDIALLARRKRSINNGFVNINDNQLYSDENDLISNLRRKIYLPVYHIRTKRFVLLRTTRSATVECPWQEATLSSSTGTDYYPKKPSDKQSVDISIGGDSNEKKKVGDENIDLSEDDFKLRENKEDEIKKE